MEGQTRGKAPPERAMNAVMMAMDGVEPRDSHPLASRFVRQARAIGSAKLDESDKRATGKNAKPSRRRCDGLPTPNSARQRCSFSPAFAVLPNTTFPAAAARAIKRSFDLVGGAAA